MKNFTLRLCVCLAAACGDASVDMARHATEPLPQVTAVGERIGIPIAYVYEPLRLTNDEEHYVVKVETLNASSYRYAVVLVEMIKRLQHRQLAATVLSDPKFVAKLMQSAGDALITRIAQDKATADRVQAVALLIATNSKIFPAVQKSLSKEELDELIALATGGDDPKKMLDALTKLSKNDIFMAALLPALAMNGDFLSQTLAIGEDNSLLAEILDEEFINELIASGKEGDLLSRMMKIDVAVEQLEVIMERLLEDEETLQKLLLPSSFKIAQDLMKAFMAKVKELAVAKAAGVDTDVNYIREQITALLDEMKGDEHKQLMAIIFSDLLFEAAFIAYHPSFCEENSVEWTTVKDLDEELLIDNLSDEGWQVLCLKAIDDNGNEQPEPTLEPIEPPETTEPPVPLPPVPLPPVPLINLGGNLPAYGSSSALKNLRVEISATTDTLAGYRWLLLRHGGDCPLNPDVYDAYIHSMPMLLTIELKTAGEKTLCVFGVNSERKLATPIASHTWEFLVVRSKARLEISGSTQDLYFGDYKEIVLRNVGNEGMFWHIYTPNDIDWLEIREKTGEWISLRRASTQKQLLRGAMLAQDIVKLQLRVVDIADEMQKEVLYVKHLDSALAMPIKLTLHSSKPRLTVQNGNVDLTPEKSSAWIGVVNTNQEGTLRWKVHHIFPIVRTGINITATREDRIDRDGWHVGAGNVKVEMLFRPRPTTAKVQVFIFEFRGGKRISVAVSYIPSGWRQAD